MSTDRELLELAAKAVGMHVLPEGAPWPDEREGWFFNQVGDHPPALYDRATMARDMWAPLTDDGDALSVAVKLRMTVRVEDYGASARIDDKPHGAWSGCEAHLHGGIEAATRRAIVRAAAAIGEAMP